MITIAITGLEKLQRKYSRDLRPAIRAGTFAIGEQLRFYLAKDPGPVHYPIKWASRKQRLWYFAMRRQQGLGLPYVRNSDPGSQRLVASWSTESVGQTDARVFSHADHYAKWVQSAEFQQPMHKATGWVTDQRAIEQLQQSGKAGLLMHDALMHALEG